MPQRLAQHLIARGLLPARIVDEALRRVEAEGGTLDTVLLELGAVSEASILQALADVSQLRQVNLADFEPNLSASAHLPLGLAQKLNIVPLSLDGNALHVACAFPIPRAKLKNLGFVLGRRIELWVALECRLRAWQAALYGLELEPRYARLVGAAGEAPLSPSSRDAAALTTHPEQGSALTSDLLERIARGIVEEPLLLDRPKRPSGTSPRAQAPVVEESPTTVVEAAAYQRFARADQGLSHERAWGPPAPEGSETVRLDTRGYERLARELTRTSEAPHEQVTPPRRISFPGGVLPPRQVPPAPPPLRQPARPSLLKPESPPRARADRSARPKRPSPKPLPPSRPTATAPVDPDLDFSEVAEVLKGHEAARPPPQGREAPRAPRAQTPSPRQPESSSAGEAQALPPALPPAPPPAPPDASTAPAPHQPSPARPEAAGEPPGLEPARGQDWSLDQARQALEKAKEDRDELLSVVLDFGRRTFEFVAVFAAMKGAAVGWESRGGPGAVRAIRQVAIPLDAASVFRTVALTRGSYVGPLPSDALTQHYLSLLGRTPRAVFLWPIEVKSRLVAMVYGDGGPRPMSQRRLSDFVLFCRELSAAFHELIIFRRNNARISQILPAPPVEPAPPPPEATLPTPSKPETADEAWFPSLLALLTGPEAAQRATAMLELARRPAEAAAALARAFPGPTGWSRRPVTELPDPDELGPVPGALARLGDEGARALVPLLSSSDGGTRYLALLTAGALRHPSVLDGVWAGLLDVDPDLSSAARVAAAALKAVPGFEERLAPLRRSLSAADPLEQSLAARALGAVHDRASVETLIAQTGSADVLVAQSAAEALRDITRASLSLDRQRWSRWWDEHRGRRRVEWLVEALADADREVRQAAIEELSRALSDSLGFTADAPEAERTAALERWRARVAERPSLEV